MRAQSVAARRLEQAEATVNSLKAKEASKAVVGLGKTLFGALFDVGLSAASAASAAVTNTDAAGLSEAQERLRAQRRAEEQAERWTLFEGELAILGISAEEAAQLDERKLRTIFRARSRELHPDATGGAAAADAADAADADGNVVPSICESLAPASPNPPAPPLTALRVRRRTPSGLHSVLTGRPCDRLSRAHRMTMTTTMMMVMPTMMTRRPDEINQAYESVKKQLL